MFVTLHKLVDYRCDSNANSSKDNVPNPFCYACKYLQTLFDFEKRKEEGLIYKDFKVNNAAQKGRKYSLKRSNYK